MPGLPTPLMTPLFSAALATTGLTSSGFTATLAVLRAAEQVAPRIAAAVMAMRERCKGSLRTVVWNATGGRRLGV